MSGKSQVSDEEPPPESSWAFLGLIRFFLAMAVFIGHYALMVDKSRLNLFGFGFFAAASAVYGFFILSGYSIAASLERKATGFYKRRFVRIWPLYLFSLAFGLVVIALLPEPFKFPLDENYKEGFNWITIVGCLFLLQGFFFPWPFWTCGVTWSLSPEWWWYMVAPFLKKISLWILLSLMLLSLIQFIQWNWGFNLLWYLHSRQNNMHAFNVAAWGPGFGPAISGLFWLWISGFIYYRFRRTPLGFCILAFPCVLAFFFGRSVGFPCFATIFALILCEEFQFSVKVVKFFDFLGDLSYPIYLFHVAVMALMVWMGCQGLWVYCIGVVGVSAVLVYAVDYPLRNLLANKQKLRSQS
jgi:peptidoglycan/LPS O-acetylase OafA/YrhL